MLKTKKLLFLIPLVVVVLLVGTYCTLLFGFSIDIFDQSGWESQDGTVRYLDYYGKPLLKWQDIDRKSYYFDAETGNMCTGWQDIQGSRYYFGEDGVMQTGWLTLDGKTYYLAGGTLIYGWQELYQQKYYFGTDGVMAVGWQSIDASLYYFEENGAPANGWKELDDSRYYFTENGKAVTGWHSEDAGKYFFADDGKMQTGWVDWEQKRYYFDESGIMTTGWLEMGGDRYYFGEDGRMAIGEVKIGDVSRFFTSTGKYVIMPNPWNPVPADFENDMVDIKGYKFDRNGRDALQAMMDACTNAGYYCGINNTYRSYATQKYMWDVRIERRMNEGMTYEEAVAYTGRSVALPGHSEHQTGLAVDVDTSDAGKEWLMEHCWEYGFILRYPDGKRSVTGIIFEPWHYRYVGTEISMEMKELGLCMEEYMAMLTEQQAQIS